MKRCFEPKRLIKNSPKQNIDTAVLDDREMIKSDQINEENKNQAFTQDQISSFIDEEDLINVFISNLTNYNKFTQSVIHHVVKKFDVSKHVFRGEYDHGTNINTRLNFLTFLAAHSSYKISYDELSSIQKVLIDESKIRYDKEAVSRWLQKCILKHQNLNEIFDMKDENVKNIMKQNLNKNK